MVLAVLWAPGAGRAEAGRVVVLSVSGEGGGEYEDILVNALSDDHSVIDSRDFEQAVTNIERAVELLPADPIIGEHLGDAYWRVERRLEARFQWQHAKDNKPEPDDLKRIEDKMKNGLPEEVPVTPAQNGTDQNKG